MTLVKVLRITEDGSEQFERFSELRDCFPDDDQNDSDYHAAAAEIQRSGRVWVGGGGSPMFLLIRQSNGGQ